MAQQLEGKLVKGPYKPIHRNCAIYFLLTVLQFQILVSIFCNSFLRSRTITESICLDVPLEICKMVSKWVITVLINGVYWGCNRDFFWVYLDFVKVIFDFIPW